MAFIGKFFGAKTEDEEHLDDEKEDEYDDKYIATRDYDFDNKGCVSFLVQERMASGQGGLPGAASLSVTVGTAAELVVDRLSHVRAS